MWKTRFRVAPLSRLRPILDQTGLFMKIVAAQKILKANDQLAEENRRRFSAAGVFGIPGILMFVATLVFWLGRHRYVMVPLPPKDPHSFANVVRTALLTVFPILTLFLVRILY